MRSECCRSVTTQRSLLATLILVGVSGLGSACGDDPPGGGSDASLDGGSGADSEPTTDLGLRRDASADAGPEDGARPVDAGDAPDGSWTPADAGWTLLPCDLDEVTRLSAKELQTCALTRGGGVTCWGSGSNFGRDSHDYPASVQNLSPPAAQLSAGFQHVCVVTSTGGAACWGNNDSGQLGNGSLTAATMRVNVVGLHSGVLAVASGVDHSCALLQGGTVKCWGYNRFGQLGNDSTEDSPVPVDVIGLSGVDAIAAGQYHTCALAAGQMKCWGSNQQGRLGDQTYEDRHTPVDVVGLPGPVASIWPGNTHTCAIMESGPLYCWGYNHAGQLGDGTQNESIIPLEVGGANVVQVGLGNSHTCVRRQNGSVSCWGEDHHGKLGNGRETWGRSLTATVSLPGPALDLVVGNQNGCVLLEEGEIYCWGWNEHGELGDGPSYAVHPEQVPGVTDAVSTALGAFHSCALTGTGEVRCWGAPTFTGDPEGVGSNGAPITVGGLPGPKSELKAGSYHTCAKSESGELHCWGANGYGQLGDGNDRFIQGGAVLASLLGPVVHDFSGGWGHTCVTLADGTARCVGGYNAWGQLGDGSTEDSTTPVDVLTMGLSMDQVSLGAYHSCATGTTADSLYCWGNNQGGQLGPRGGDTSIPELVSGLPTGFSQVRTGTFSTCVLGANNSVFCYGGGYPRPMPRLTQSIAQLAVGEGHICVRYDTGVVACWGENRLGQCGVGLSELVELPTTVSLPRPAVDLSSADQHSCATMDDGRVYCWGREGQGQIRARFSGYPKAVSCP